MVKSSRPFISRWTWQKRFSEKRKELVGMIACRPTFVFWQRTQGFFQRQLFDLKQTNMSGKRSKGLILQVLMSCTVSLSLWNMVAKHMMLGVFRLFFHEGFVNNTGVQQKSIDASHERCRFFLQRKCPRWTAVYNKCVGFPLGNTCWNWKERPQIKH